MDDLLHFVRHEVAMDGDDGESMTCRPSSRGSFSAVQGGIPTPRRYCFPIT